jgi:lipoprotein-anchoring transpeptidase ErfK/SrfK
MRYSRRLFVATAAVAPFVAVRAALASQDLEGQVRSNISAFQLHRWQDHFDSLGVGIIISDTTGKVLQHWTGDGQMYVYPTSVPLTDELTRRGYTEVVEKRVNPSWAPTPSMRERNPEWPEFVPGGDPNNPLGTRALYLSWQYYRIHGTHDTRKIGRRSSNGCIGLYNEHIEEVFDRTPVGTQVKLI